MRCLFFLALLGAFLLTAGAVSISADFVQVLPRSALTPSQIRNLDQISGRRTTDGGVEIVRINPAPLRESSHFTLPLPGRSPVTVEANTKNVASDRSFSIIGQVSGLPNGTTTIVVNEDSVTGSLQTDSGPYRIVPLGGGAHVLVKVGRFPPDHPK
jgi:hypothetical protein